MSELLIQDKSEIENPISPSDRLRREKDRSYERNAAMLQLQK